MRRFHLGHDDGRDPASLNKFNKLLRRAKIAENCTNFRACEELVNHVYDGHILGLCMDVLKVETIDALGEELRHCDIIALVEKIYSRGFELGLVQKMREENGLACEDNCGIILENAILFMQVSCVYRELCDAIQ